MSIAYTCALPNQETRSTAIGTDLVHKVTDVVALSVPLAVGSDSTALVDICATLCGTCLLLLPFNVLMRDKILYWYSPSPGV